MRPKGTANELANRRRLAVQRVRDGYTVAEVAAFLGASERSVYRWLAAARDYGDRAGLNPKPHKGPKPRLDIQQQGQVLDWLDEPPSRHGFATELWTAPRLAQLIHQRFGVRYHPRYVNRWLADRGVRPLKPSRRAREQDPQQVSRWLDGDWLPLVQEVGLVDGWVVFLDEAGLLLEPLWRRSQARRGHPAVLQYAKGHRRKVSLLGALAWRPKTGEIRQLSWSIVDGYFDSVQVAGVLRELLAELSGQVRVIWDRGTMHKGPAIKAVKEEEKDRLQTLFLPAYTPEANPVERLWSLLKYGKLSNFLPRGVIHLALEAAARLEEIDKDPQLLRGCFQGTILPLPDNMTLAA
jgi:transposase